MKKGVVIGCLFIICLFSTTVAWGWGPVGGQWSDWTQKTPRFHYEKGRLTLLPAEESGRAVMQCNYPAVADNMQWELPCLLDRKPTNKNYFKFFLFFSEQGGRESWFYVAPDNSGEAVALFEEWRPVNTTQVNTQKLATIVLSLPSMDWQNLTIRVVKQGNSLQLKATNPRVRPMEAPAVKVELGSKLTPQMSLLANYTRTLTATVAWRLPTVWSQEATQPPQVEVLDIQQPSSRQLLVRLDKPLGTDLASATLNAIPVRLLPTTNPQTLLLELPEPIQPGTVYTLVVNDVTDQWGNKFPLSITFDTPNETAPPAPSPLPVALQITEVMSSPPAEAPLKGVKYIELYNGWEAPVELSGYTLRHGSKKIKLPNGVIPARSYVLLVPEQTPTLSDAPQYELSRFPTLTEKGSYSLVLLQDNEEVDRWDITPYSYGYGLPAGQASIERITFGEQPLSLRSRNPKGGTPGLPSGIVPPQQVPPGAVAITEVLFSPKTRGEKYLELFNTTANNIDLADLYFAYRSSPDANYSYAYVTKDSRPIPPGGYAVLTPYPQTLVEMYPGCRAEALVEYIAFPSFGSTYADIQLRSRASNEVTDHIVVRKQYYGTNVTATGKALERIGPKQDGTLPASWQVALESVGYGTPTLANSVAGNGTTPPNNILELDTLLEALEHYEQADMRVYSPLGNLVAEAHGPNVEPLLLGFRNGQSFLQPGIYVLHLTIQPTGKLAPIRYTAKWLLRW